MASEGDARRVTRGAKYPANCYRSRVTEPRGNRPAASPLDKRQPPCYTPVMWWFLAGFLLGALVVYVAMSLMIVHDIERVVRGARFDE